MSAPAIAQETDDRAAREAIKAEIDSETHGSVFPGPREGETRVVWVWRAQNAPATGPIPTLYMFDGMDGLYVALLRLKDDFAAGAVPGVQVIAIDPHPEPRGRASEYVFDWPGGRDDFALHRAWFLEQVLPWAERTQRAARDPAHRFVGGFSNGADLSMVLASQRPDLFGGALLHSPYGANPDWIGENVTGQRWVVTQGTREMSGSLHRHAALGHEIEEVLLRRGGDVRACYGPWRHEGRAWREVSPGSIVWLMGLGDWRAANTETERETCRTPPPPSP